MTSLKILLLAAAIAAAGCLQAAASPKAAEGQPDILVLVYANLGPVDQVGLTYPKTVPHSQVQRDLKQLAAQTGWTQSNVKIEDAPYKANGDILTDAQFVTRDVVPPGSQTLPLAQLVLALRTYPHLSVTYLLPKPMDFRGLRDYTDSDVDVHFDAHDTAYTYHVRVLNPNFDKLNLPQYEPVTKTVAAQPQERSRRVRAWQVVLLAVIAAGAGIGVYFATSRRA